jgi:hypothetical protein
MKLRDNQEPRSIEFTGTKARIGDIVGGEMIFEEFELPIELVAQLEQSEDMIANRKAILEIWHKLS